jgi:Gram-negative bacterial TonB protein C-terminal
MRAAAIHGACAIGLLCVAGGRLHGQARPDSTRCDSIVRSAAVDSAKTAIFVFADQTDYDWLFLNRGRIETRISRDFAAPRPFRLSVFEGPSLVRGLRISSPGDSVGVRRGASVMGTYRVDVSSGGIVKPLVVRSSLLPGFDSAMVRAIRTAALMGTALRPPFGESWRLQVHVSTDSLEDSRRIAQGVFPVMLVRDASPLTTERPPFPEAARADSLDHGEAVLRFVVDRDGKPALETVEIVRATSFEFARAAIVVLGAQTFNAATIRGCPVAQLVEFPFVFDSGDRPPP